MTESDTRIYEAGEALPDHWVDVAPIGDGPFRVGTITFLHNTEVTFKSGWLRLHALEPAGKDGVILFDGFTHADIHFCHDMGIYDHDGSLIAQVICDPGAKTWLDET